MSVAGTGAARAASTRTRGERVWLIAGEAPPQASAEIRALLAREGFEVTCFASAEDSERAAAQRPVAIVLWQAQLAGATGGALEPLCRRFACELGGQSRTPVVVACASVQRREVRAALAAGAAGVIVREDLQGTLGAVLRAVRAGQLCVPREHWREVEPPVLSMREKQVLQLAARGYMNRQIADRLFLAESTVKSHLSSAF
ncbi:MAG TPA: LuxR C-terminal-related transcriptional regulator, partial [Solirubrobacteraceae bacterium]|nr:LuxR C-terminal-related transcriptional regulator [Solirubrobacteraceae bacterium]